jgi:hypothetical protein
MALPTRALLLGLAASACTYDEGLNIHDLSGTVTLPREAVTRTMIDPATGLDVEVTDTRNIGPVYVGLYPSLDFTLDRFPLPEEIREGFASPYSGTTIGDIRYACFEFFQCRMVSGRFTSYDDIIDYFTNVVGEVPEDEFGRPIEVGQYIQQTCFDLLEVTADWEIRILPDDNNDDGKIDKLDLDWQEDENGDFVANFEILQADFYPGMTAWAFLDDVDFIVTQEEDGRTIQKVRQFETCDNSRGYTENTYNRNFRAGLQRTDVLNTPRTYLNGTETWVASQGYTWDDYEAEANIVLDFNVETGPLAATSDDGGN